jgi:hypothetical protein
MNLKQFLKPDNRKKIIFVILFLLYSSAFFTFNSSFCGPAPLSGPMFSEQNCSHHYEKYWMPCNLYCGEPDLLTSIINAVYYPLWLIGIFIIYLISCFLVWLYDRFKNIKTKK